eukprot:1151436-Rhodomonas_salina.1
MSVFVEEDRSIKRRSTKRVSVSSSSLSRRRHLTVLEVRCSAKSKPSSHTPGTNTTEIAAVMHLISRRPDTVVLRLTQRQRHRETETQRHRDGTRGLGVSG